MLATHFCVLEIQIVKVVARNFYPPLSHRVAYTGVFSVTIF
jgi:hypothetical protein